MISRRAISVLVTFAAVAPVAIAILLGASRLLGAMSDEAGAAVLDRLALAAGLAWVLALVCLVVALGIRALDDREPPQNP